MQGSRCSGAHVRYVHLLLRLVLCLEYSAFRYAQPGHLPVLACTGSVSTLLRIRLFLVSPWVLHD